MRLLCIFVSNSSRDPGSGLKWGERERRVDVLSSPKGAWGISLEGTDFCIYMKTKGWVTGGGEKAERMEYRDWADATGKNKGLGIGQTNNIALEFLLLSQASLVISLWNSNTRTLRQELNFTHKSQLVSLTQQK